MEQLCTLSWERATDLCGDEFSARHLPHFRRSVLGWLIEQKFSESKAIFGEAEREAESTFFKSSLL